MAKAHSKRYHFIDEVRGFLVILMIFFHLFYDMGDLFSIGIGTTLFNFFAPAEPFFASLFIFICGMSCKLSSNNYKRGVQLLFVAMAFSIVSTIIMPDFAIYFGILHLLAFSILIFALCEPIIDKIHWLIGMILTFVLFISTYNLPNGYIGFASFSIELPGWLYSSINLLPFGLIPSNVATADYFPLIPYIFIFLCGGFYGVTVKRGNVPNFYRNMHIRPLAFVGRHALIVYILHQPVIYGILMLYNYIAGLF